MSTRRTTLIGGVLLAVSLASGTKAGDNKTQTVLHLYGPSGPSPAISESAVAFEMETGVRVDIISGPVEEWRAQAAQNADLVYASADFMMTDLQRDARLAIDPASITPLFLRPSVILVRPGNPKEIKDFPDLLRPDIKFMVVSGSGQVGLWEDMAGKLGDIRSIRAMRKQIAHFAANSDEAVKVWRTRPEIDAWLTWNIWHAPLRSEAQVVPVSNEYRIFRQCGIALTARGRETPAARQFVDWLLTEEAAAIFESWGWLDRVRRDCPLKIGTDVGVVCHVSDDVRSQGVGRSLACVEGLLQQYSAMGVPADEVHVVVVVSGDAVYWMLNDTAYRAHTKNEAPNPNAALIEKLLSKGVKIEACGETLRQIGRTAGELLPGVTVIPASYPRIVDLELQGYAFLRL